MVQTRYDDTTIAVFDTSIATLNIGDEVIMDGVRAALYEVFPRSRFIGVPTHEVIFRSGLSIIRNSTHAMVGGSNLLSSNMHGYRQWKIGVLDSFLISGKVILMGVGWRAYQGEVGIYTKLLLRNLLDSNMLHAVRDAYTENKLRQIGIHNVVNTSCASMWGLTAEHCREIPVEKADTAIFTLADGNKDPTRDRYLIEILLAEYSDVACFIQGIHDREYLDEFGDLLGHITLIPPNLPAFDSFLQENPCDYIGMRLHAGIRALQHKRRAIIVGIDNRATEKKNDFNLPVVAREDIGNLLPLIRGTWRTEIILPTEKIEAWKSQFMD